jgi:hypothetical protein
MGNSGALKRRSHGSTADIATVQARSPKNGITPGKIEALNLRLQTRPIQLSHWPTASRQRPKIPDRISERPPRGGLFDSGTRRHALLILLALVPRSTPASLDLIVRGSCPRSAFGLKGFINPVSSIITYEPLSAGHPYIKVLQSVDTVLARMNCCDPPWDNGLGTQLNNTFTSISTQLK